MSGSFWLDLYFCVSIKSFAMNFFQGQKKNEKSNLTKQSIKYNVDSCWILIVIVGYADCGDSLRYL